MAIIELAGKLTAAELSGAGLLPGPLPLGRRLEVHFLRQVRALPATTQALLLVAAAEPSGDPRLITRAAARARKPPSRGRACAAQGVIVMYPEARFRHPLIRSAVYGGASPADRRRAHRALAAEMDPQRDADRRHGTSPRLRPARTRPSHPSSIAPPAVPRRAADTQPRAPCWPGGPADPRRRPLGGANPGSRARPSGRRCPRPGEVAARASG